MGTEKKAAAEVQENQTEQGYRTAIHGFRGWPARQAERKSGTGAASESTDRSAGQTR